MAIDLGEVDFSPLQQLAVPLTILWSALGLALIEGLGVLVAGAKARAAALRSRRP